MVDVYTIPCGGCNKIGQEGLRRIQDEDFLAEVQHNIPTFANDDYICAACIKFMETYRRQNHSLSTQRSITKQTNLTTSLESSTENEKSVGQKRLSTSRENDAESLEAPAKRPRIGPKSRMLQLANQQQCDRSSEFVNQTGLSTSQESETERLDAPAKRPKIGPQSKNNQQQQPVKPKIGPKSRMLQANQQQSDRSSSSLDTLGSSEVLQQGSDLSDEVSESANQTGLTTSRESETDRLEAPAKRPKIGPKSKINQQQQPVKPKLGPKSKMLQANQQQSDRSSSSLDSLSSSEVLPQRQNQTKNVPSVSESSMPYSLRTVISRHSTPAEFDRYRLASQEEIIPEDVHPTPTNAPRPARTPFFPPRTATSTVVQPGNNRMNTVPSSPASNSDWSEDSFDRLVERTIGLRKPGPTVARPPSIITPRQNRMPPTLHQPVVRSSPNDSSDVSGSGSDMDPDDIVPLNQRVRPSKRPRMRVSPPRRPLSPLSIRDVGDFKRNNAG